MADDMERAQRACEQNTDDALANQRAAQVVRDRRFSRAASAPPICAACDEAIPIERLTIYPDTKFCKTCAEEMEHQMKREATWM